MELYSWEDLNESIYPTAIEVLSGLQEDFAVNNYNDDILLHQKSFDSAFQNCYISKYDFETTSASTDDNLEIYAHNFLATNKDVIDYNPLSYDTFFSTGNDIDPSLNQDISLCEYIEPIITPETTDCIELERLLEVESHSDKSIPIPFNDLRSPNKEDFDIKTDETRTRKRGRTKQTTLNNDLENNNSFKKKNIPPSGPNKKKSRRKKVVKKCDRWLGEKVISILEKWYKDHKNYPYPTDIERKQLLEETNLPYSKLVAWLSNKRNRDNNTIPKNRIKSFHQNQAKNLNQLESVIGQLCAYLDALKKDDSIKKCLEKITVIIDEIKKENVKNEKEIIKVEKAKNSKESENKIILL